MRRACQDTDFIEHDGELIGLCLGADYCAEHEWGIKGIHRQWGIPWKTPGVYGFARRQVTVVPDFLRFLEDKKEAILWADEIHRDGPFPEKVKDFLEAVHCQELHLAKPDDRFETKDLVAAWDESGFAIRVRGDKKGFLKTLYEAALRKDLVICLKHTGNPFSNAGLTLLISSKIPQDVVDRCRAGDVDHEEMIQAAKDTGVEDRLRKAGKQWFALSPKWAKEIKSTKDGEIKTTHPVIFWLNPMQQDKNNSGWYTVEQLDQWANNQGPIPKL